MGEYVKKAFPSPPTRVPALAKRTRGPELCKYSDLNDARNDPRKRGKRGGLKKKTRGEKR